MVFKVVLKVKKVNIVYKNGSTLFCFPPIHLNMFLYKTIIIYNNNNDMAVTFSKTIKWNSPYQPKIIQQFDVSKLKILN